jgi:ABC-type antimicrobial peptide transport system permease subunit
MAFESDRLLALEFPVKILDPIAFVLAGLALAVVIVIAMMVPATRATSVDPAMVLRQE